MNYNELVKILKQNGFFLIRTGKSSSRLYSNGDRCVNVHYHSSKEISTKMANAYLKMAGIKRK